MDTLVSVIVPVYRVEKYINEAVNSIIHQTYKNLEIILVDDGSPDNCGQICDEYAACDSRIKVIHKKNSGVSAARNTGIEVAEGKWIYFMDPDDWIELDAIEKALEFAVKNNCGMCMFDYDEVFKNKSIHHSALKYQGNVFTELDRDNLFLAYACAMGTIWNMITKASIIKQLKFDEYVSVREDELFKFQLYSKLKSFCYIREDLYHYRCCSFSALNSRDQSAAIINNDAIYEDEIKLISNALYPKSAVKAVHSKYLESFFGTCCAIFEQEISCRKKYFLYKEYVNGKKFKESIQNFSDLYFSRVNAICLKRGKAPHWLFVCSLVKIRDVKKLLWKKEKFG